MRIGVTYTLLIATVLVIAMSVLFALFAEHITLGEALVVTALALIAAILGTIKADMEDRRR